MDYPEPTALVLGNEITGIDTLVRLPTPLYGTLYLFISLKKSTPLHNRQLDILISNSKH